MTLLDWMHVSQLLLLAISIALSLDARRRAARAEKILAETDLLISTKPTPAACTAMLRSGEGCLYAAGHKGAHKAFCQSGPQGHSQDYAWEDPTNGVHSAGFFYR